MQENNYLASKKELIIVKCSEDQLHCTALKMKSYCTKNVQMLADTKISTKQC